MKKVVFIFFYIICCIKINAQNITFSFDETKGKSYVYVENQIVKTEQGKIISIFNYDTSKIIYRFYEFEFTNSSNDFDGTDIIKAITPSGKTIYSINTSSVFSAVVSVLTDNSTSTSKVH
jgi:hypothetical protein